MQSIGLCLILKGISRLLTESPLSEMNGQHCPFISDSGHLVRLYPLLNGKPAANQKQVFIWRLLDEGESPQTSSNVEKEEIYK